MRTKREKRTYTHNGMDVEKFLNDHESRLFDLERRNAWPLRVAGTLARYAVRFVLPAATIGGVIATTLFALGAVGR